jgi:hypothetical protein
MSDTSSSSLGFRRYLYPRGDRTVIKAICQSCGFGLVADHDELLRQQEAQHLANCAGKQSPGARKTGDAA